MPPHPKPAIRGLRTATWGGRHNSQHDPPFSRLPPSDRPVRGASQGELSFGCCSSPSAYASFLLILAGSRHAQFCFGPSCGSHLTLPVFLLCFPVLCFRSRCLFLPPRIVVLCFTLLFLINETRARNLRVARALCRNCNYRGYICSALCFEYTVRSDDHLCHGLSGLCEPAPCSIRPTLAI